MRSLPLKQNDSHRRGSTLIIIIALLGLLAFTGMVFFTFASQERAAAEYFSEGAKTASEEPDDPFPWALHQMISGPTNRPEHKASILWSPTQRFSMSRSLVGSDAAPLNGEGLRVKYSGSIPIVTSKSDTIGDPLSNRLNFVEALSAWGSPLFFGRNAESQVVSRRDFVDSDNTGTSDVVMPEPDVDYTAPDINSPFLAMKTWSIRDNGVEEDVNLNGILDSGEDTNGNGKLDRRYEQVLTFIPSWFRPQYLKSTQNNYPTTTAGTMSVPTDPDWYNETIDATHQQYSTRSFRPHALHISGFDSSGNPVLRYLDKNNPAHAAAIAALPGGSGHFPLRRNEGNANFSNSANFGRLGVWTGDGSATNTSFELDSDNDGDGIREGIWIDLRYPIQETPDGRKYTVLHSFTIYDLDALIDLNVHGNLYGLPRGASSVPSLASGGGTFESTHLSQSNLGTGPHEVNPLYALAPASVTSDPKFVNWYGSNPSNRLEQANMEWLWLITGRIDTTGANPEVLDGRWGDASALWYHRFGAGNRSVASLPRPGGSGQLAKSAATLPSYALPQFNNFSGMAGYDDNNDVLFGTGQNIVGWNWGFVHPLDFSGRGRRTNSTNPLLPNLFAPTGGKPHQWLQYVDYPVMGTYLGESDNVTYVAGMDGDPSQTADNLAILTDATDTTNYNARFEDPYETIMDQDRAARPDDQIFVASDLIDGHLTTTDADNATGLSDRLSKLAPITFSKTSGRSDFFTTLSNSFLHFPIMHDFAVRPWEWTADADNDGRFEFPPKFGTVVPFSKEDPLRPQLRRFLTSEFGESRHPSKRFTQLPIRLDGTLVDVARNLNVGEGTPEFLNYATRAPLLYRNMVDHVHGTHSDIPSDARNSLTDVVNAIPGTPHPDRSLIPSSTAIREFWARRDRQQLARDIYVLLYTLGGAEFDTSLSQVKNYTGPNTVDPMDSTRRLLYSEDRLRQMAQFAVNLVDAIDQDDVITKFEYDKNLNDGWGLDDDPFTYSSSADPAINVTTVPSDLTRSGMYPDDAGDRGVVFGVEAQTLAFSEVLGVTSRNTGDSAATPYDDSRPSGGGAGTNFLFIELQNMAPAAVNLGPGLSGSESVDKTIWRIVRQDRIAANTSVQSATEVSSTIYPSYFLAFRTTSRNVISGGGRFSIAMTNAELPGGGSPPSSDLFVDLGAYDSAMNTYLGDFDGTYELVAPNSLTGSMPTTSTPTNDPAWNPRADLDLIAHTNSFFQNSSTTFLAGINSYAGHNGLLATGVAPANGIGLEDPNAFSSATEGFDLILQRKLHPQLPSIANESENPWIEVDRVKVQMRDFNIDVMDTAAQVRGDSALDRVRHIVSSERAEPLLDVKSNHNVVTTGTRAFRSNSIKGDISATPDDYAGVNTSSPANFQLLQMHHDRNLASLGELLNIPVFPPNLLTQRLKAMYRSPYQQLGGATPNLLKASGAAAMFLWPDLTPETGDAANASDNRWYRILSLLDVPSGVNRGLGSGFAAGQQDLYVSDSATLNRIPGKLNLNTLRHREVFAGLVDDPQFVNVDPLGDFDSDGDPDGPFSWGTSYDGDDGILDNSTITSRDRWLEFINERDGNVLSVFDPTPNLPNSGDEVSVPFWISGTPNSRPFRSLSFRDTLSTSNDDNGLESTVMRRFGLDKPQSLANRENVAGEDNASYSKTSASLPATNRNWLEVGSRQYHESNSGAPTATMLEHHQVLSKVIGNTTTVSNAFIAFGTAAYFEVHEDPTTGLIQVGGRMGLDLDNDSDPKNDAGWEKRAVFIIDRTEFYNAYDPGSGNIDWKRMVKFRQDLSSDGK